jgi:carboxymethylenebutenolidase
MSAESYVNMVPLMIGARGRAELHDFYASHFLSQIPPDLEMVAVSRTVGQGRVVDELVARFTHSIRLDWLLPGIPPTGRRIDLPFVVVVQFEGRSWPTNTSTGTRSRSSSRSASSTGRTPVLGGETAAQVLNPVQPMNELIRRASRPADPRG